MLFAITTCYGGNGYTDEWLTHHSKSISPGVDTDVWLVIAIQRKGRLGLFRWSVEIEWLEDKLDDSNR